MVEAGRFAAVDQRRRRRHNSAANLHCCHWRFLATFLTLAAFIVRVNGAPILGPDLTTCDPVLKPGTVDEMVECCLLDRPTKDFQLPAHLPLRVRRPLHTPDEKSVRQFEHGIALMRALPDDDPRSWFQQFKLHCAYTSNVYRQRGEFATNEYISVHFNYLFLPYHRWFTYFQERIIATLIGDDSFAIPYWAWELQGSSGGPINIIPAMFTNQSSPFYDPNRSLVHVNQSRVDLLLQQVAHDEELERLAASNYYQMWRTMKGECGVPEVFFGSKLGLGEKNVMAGGPFEMGPHTAVHVWLGNYQQFPAGEDMAQPYVSARDPLFTVHHSQVDRMWQMWKDFGHRDLDDPDFLSSEFLFYDEQGDRVRVNVSGCLDLEKLRISYEHVEVDWPERTDPPVMSIRARGDSKYAPITAWDNAWRHIVDTSYFSTFGALFWKTSTTKGRMLSKGGRGGGVVTARVPRPPMSLRDVKIRRNGGDGNGMAVKFDEVLVLRGKVSKPFHKKVILNLFVELPEVDSSTPLDCLESTGQIYIEPSRSLGEGRIVTREFHYKTGIGGKFKKLGIIRHRSVAVSLVPTWDARDDADISVQVTELRMESRVIE